MRCSLTFSICGWFAFAYSLPPTGARVVVEIGDGQIQVPVLNPGGSVGSNSLVWEVNAAGTTVVYGISIGLEPSGKVITRTVSTLQLTTDTRSSGLSVVGIAVASENSDGVLITSFRPKSDIPSVPASATTFSILDTDRPGSSFLIVGIGVVSTASQNLGSGPVSATIPSALSIIIQSAFPVIGQVTGSAAGGAILVAETDSAGHDLVVAVPLKGVQNHHPTSFLSTSSLSTPAATSTISILPASASVQAMTTTSCSTAGAMITTTQKGNNKVTVVPEICAAGLLPAVGVGALSFILFNFAFGCLSTYSLLGFVFHFRCNSDNNPTAISVELKPTPFELPKSPKPSQHSLGSSTCSGSVSTTIAGTPVCCATSVVITGETYCALASATLVDVMLDLGTKPKGPEGDAIQYPSNFNFASLESNSAYQPSGGDDSHLATGAPRPTVMSSSKFSATKTTSLISASNPKTSSVLTYCSGNDKKSYLPLPTTKVAAESVCDYLTPPANRLLPTATPSQLWCAYFYEDTEHSCIVLNGGNGIGQVEDISCSCDDGKMYSGNECCPYPVAVVTGTA